jgi:hypothetical protein
MNTCDYSPYVTSSLPRGWVCGLQLLVLASTVTFRSEWGGTHDHVLLSQNRYSPNLEGKVPVFISPRNRAAQLYPHAPGSLSVASYDWHDYGGVRARLHNQLVLVSSPRFIYSLTVTVSFLWGALSDERMGLSFVYAAGPRQRSLSRVRVPWILDHILLH